MEGTEERDNLPGQPPSQQTKPHACVLADHMDPENKRVMNNTVAQKSSQPLLQLQTRVLQWVNLNPSSTILERSELLKGQSLNHQHTTYMLMNPSQAGRCRAPLAE